MQDRGDEEVDLERMSDGYESDESPLPPVDNPCNGLKRQENIGNAQVFESNLKKKTPNPSTGAELPQRTPPRKSSPKGLLNVIHVPKYLLRAPSFIRSFSKKNVLFYQLKRLINQCF